MFEWLFPKDPEIELVYFDAKGAAEAIRNTLRLFDFKFKDTRLSRAEFEERKADFPYGQVPVAYINGERIAQSKTILRCVSRLAKTYPRNYMNMAFVDELLELHTEFMFPLTLNMYPERFGLTVDENHRKWCIETHIPKYFTILNNALSQDHWLAHMTLMSAADIAWYSTLCWLRSGTFDGVDETHFENYPNLVAFVEEMHIQMTDIQMNE